MKNWKTTLFGVVSAIGFILPHFGIPQNVAAAIQTIGVFLLGLHAKDNSTTGTGM